MNHIEKSKSNEWNYVILTIAAFVFVPELRRLTDWRGAYDPLNTFAVIPLLMLCPIGVLAFRRRKALKRSAFPFLALAWIAGFAYALIIGTARGEMTAGLYSGAQFLLPVVIAFWLLTTSESLEDSHRRVAKSLLFFGAVAGLYGIFQYVLAPPWDTAWMQNLGAGSFGTPVPFGIRVFGVLNSPGIYALFLATVILINLPLLSARSVTTLAALLVIVIGLLLSLVRSGWLAVVGGVIVFLIFSPKRFNPVMTLCYVALLCVVGTTIFLSVVPDQDFKDKLFTRFSTFADIQDDESGEARRETASTTFDTALQQPIGAGLGLTGTGVKLQNDNVTMALVGAPAGNIDNAAGDIDNGFVSRFFEMGVFGFGAYMAACVGCVIATLASYRNLARNVRAKSIVAGCVAVQVAVILLNFSGDIQQGIVGIIFFAAVAIPMLSPMSVGDVSASLRKSRRYVECA